MAKKKKKSDIEIINEQIKYLYINATKFNIIMNIHLMVICERKDQNNNKYYDIGERCKKISQGNYLSAYNDAINKNEYSILFKDYSYITFYYQFDINKNLIYSSLNYVPFCQKDVDIQNNSYTRIDFEKQGHCEFFHPLSHMHFTTNKNDVRLPLDHVMTPNEFLYFVLVHIYHNKEDKLKKLDLSSKLSCSVMSLDEIKKIRISFGQ